MAEQSKFAGALARLSKPAGSAKSARRSGSEPLPHATPPALVLTGKGRPLGKRSNPDYTPTTFFVRKDTKRKAVQLLLEDVNSKADLSDLVEELLVSCHRNK